MLTLNFKSDWLPGAVKLKKMTNSIITLVYTSVLCEEETDYSLIIVSHSHLCSNLAHQWQIVYEEVNYSYNPMVLNQEDPNDLK